MRIYWITFVALMAGGCAATHPTSPVAVAQPQYEEAVAAALAFDPPIAEGAVHPELARGPRAASAVFGYQQSTTEIYATSSDDLQFQSTPWGDFYIKDSVTVKSGVNYR